MLAGEYRTASSPGPPIVPMPVARRSKVGDFPQSSGSSVAAAPRKVQSVVTEDLEPLRWPCPHPLLAGLPHRLPWPSSARPPDEPEPCKDIDGSSPLFFLFLSLLNLRLVCSPTSQLVSAQDPRPTFANLPKATVFLRAPDAWPPARCCHGCALVALSSSPTIRWPCSSIHCISPAA